MRRREKKANATCDKHRYTPSPAQIIAKAGRWSSSEYRDGCEKIEGEKKKRKEKRTKEKERKPARNAKVSLVDRYYIDMARIISRFDDVLLLSAARCLTASPPFPSPPPLPPFPFAMIPSDSLLRDCGLTFRWEFSFVALLCFSSAFYDLIDLPERINQSANDSPFSQCRLLTESGFL